MRRLLLLLVLLAAPALAERPRLNAEIDAGQKTFFAGDEKASTAHFKAALKHARNDDERSQVYGAWVALYQGAGRYREAIPVQEKLVKARASRRATEVDRTLHGDAVVRLARLHWRDGDRAGADKHFKSALSLERMPETWLARVRSEYERFQAEK